MKDMEQIQTEKETLKIGEVELKGYYSEDKEEFWVEGGIEYGINILFPRDIEYVAITGFSIQIKIKDFQPVICIKTKRIED